MTMPREEDPQIAVSGGSVIIALPGARDQTIYIETDEYNGYDGSSKRSRSRFFFSVKG